MANRTHGRTAAFAGYDDEPQVGANQCDRGGGDGDVCAGAHRDADIGGGESGSIVDAIADHRHRAARGFPVDDGGMFVRWQHVGHHFGYANFRSDFLR